MGVGDAAVEVGIPFFVVHVEVGLWLLLLRVPQPVSDHLVQRARSGIPDRGDVALVAELVGVLQPPMKILFAFTASSQVTVPFR